MKFLALALCLLVLAGCSRSAAPPTALPPVPSSPAADPAAHPGQAPPEVPASEPQTSPADLPKAEDPEAWATYQGAWFEIKYPQGFKVVPRDKSSTGESYDGVSFVSPDGRVEFYVYSPQWSGEPDWIRLQPGEEIEDRSTETDGDSKVEQVSIRGPGGKYHRAYLDRVNTAENTRLVFGIKYNSAAAYSDYRPLYLRFKESLQQFAD